MFQFTKTIAQAFAKIVNWIKGTVSPSKPTKTEFVEWLDGLPVQWISFVSSYVRAVRYDPSSEKLEVNYNGHVCTYPNISRFLFTDLVLTNESKGRWARAHLFQRAYY